MSFVTRTAKKSPRLIAICLLITLVSTIVMASKWDSVSSFLGQRLDADISGQSIETKGLKKSQLTGNLLKPESLLAPGTCDTVGPIEVEGSIDGTTPTAYATLGAAFAAINAGTHTGAIAIDVCGDTSEGATVAVLNASGSGSASYTSIVISPAGGAARTISGATTAGSPMIDFNGADNVTIDGLNTGGNSLTIANTTVSATSGTSTIRFIGGATLNTITNSNIQGSGTMSVATNGAVIFFSTDALTANGNDNNTISNNNIGPAGANLPTKAILGNGSTTTTAIGNSGIVIDNNNIFDYFGAAVTSSGIATNGGCNSWTITNNRLYQTGARTWTTGALHAGIDIRPTTSTSGAQGFTITGNTIGYASNTQTGVYTLTGAGTGAKFLGIVFNGIVSGTTSNVNNNTIAAISMTGVTSSGTTTSSPFTAILLQEGVVISNGNTIGSQSAAGSLTFSTTTTSATDIYGIHNFTSNTWTSNNNNVGGISATNLGASGTFLLIGIRAFTGSTVAWTANSNTVGGTVANSIQLNATGTASQVLGMFTSNAPANLTSNTIRNLTSNIGTGTTTTASVIGISVTTGTPNHTLSQNTIFNLSNTNATAANVVTGIQFTGSTANIVERNFIHNLTVATNSAAAEVNGIRVAGGTTVYRNNMIAIGAGIANAIGTGSTTGGVNGINEPLGTDSFFHNSVYIGGNPTAGVGPSYAFNSSQTTNTRSFRDNIFFNARSNGGATGKNYIVRVGGTTASPTGLTINNNVYFANGSGAVFGFFNSLDVANLAAWKTAVGQDAASFESNPQFLDPTNAIPDLHLNPSVATVAEGNGADVGVLNDFDGQTRSALTPVDIGADAGNYSGIDLAAPSISYTPFANTASTTNRTLSVLITDSTGVATGGNAPRIYFNKNAGTYFSTACSLASGTVQSGTWNCTIDNSLLGGVVATDVIRNFVVAQDTLGNLASNPSGGFTGTDVNTVTTAPTTPNQYTIVETFSGSINVGTGETITSLTNTGGLFERLNAGTISGNVTISITSDLTAETGTVSLNQQVEEGIGGYTITFVPSGGVQRIISGGNTNYLIRFLGADRIVFDGLNTGGNSFLIRSTGNGRTFNFQSDASNNTIQNCTIESSAGTGIAIESGTTTGNDNITVTRNIIRDRSDTTGVPGTLISNVGSSSAVANSNTIVSDNQLFNFTAGAINTSNAENVVYSGNTIYQTAPRTTALTAIFMVSAFGTNSVTQNIIRDQSTTNTFTGINLLDVRNTTVSRNRIYNISNSTGSTSALSGINFTGSSGNPASATLVNNMISIIPATNSSQIIYGIRDFGFSGNTLNVYYNSVFIGGTATGASTWAFQRGTSTPTAITLTNNIFFNNRTGGTGNHFAVGDQSANTGSWTSNYNLFAGTGVTAANFLDYGTAAAGTAVAFATWQNGPPARDANSIANVAATYNPADYFVDVAAGDLHLKSTATAVIDAGLALGSVTTDFDGDTRPQGTAPDIGADEFIPANPGTIQFSAATYSVTEGAPTVTLTVTRTGGSSGAVTANYTLGGGTATGTAACGTPGEDYVNTGGSVSFADGDAADKTFTVAICSDAVYEASQTFDATLAIGSGTATLGTPNPATVTITDDDAVPTVSIADVTQAEGNSGTGNFGFAITVTGQHETGLDFSFATANGTATAGSDYVADSGGITVPPFATGTNTFNVVVNGDTNFEPNETFFYNLSACNNCTFSDNQGLGTIQNDDVQPTVQFSSAAYTNADDISQNRGKGEELAPQVATITVTRAGAAGDAFAVNYATSNGTATGGASCGTGSGVDYVSTSGTLNFAAGEMTKTFDVTVCADNLFEGNETVNLTLTSPTAPVILGTPNPAVLTITDNDTQPSLQFSSATYTNSDDIAKYGITTKEFAPSVATITVTRTGAVDNAVAVNYATSNGTATGGATCTTGIDYVSTSGTLNFAAGVISQTFNVTVCTDALFEGSETVNLTLSNPTGGASLGTPNSAVLTIIDNEIQPSFQFSSPTHTINEANPTSTITVLRNGATGNAVSVNYATVAGGTATGGAGCGGAVDYQNTSGTLTFAAGELSKTFSVPICDDATAESSETVNLALSAPSGGAVLGSPNTAVLTITDNDAAPTLQFSSATASYTESAGNALLIVTRTGATGNAVSVDYTTGGGTATAGACAPGVDYISSNGTLNFASGETFQTISVTLCNDAVYELSQTFNATLSNATGGATIGTPNAATVTITNDDAAPSLVINDITASEGNSGTTNFQLTTTVTGANEVPGQYEFQTANNTATAPSDYTAIPSVTINIPANVNRTTSTLVNLNILVNGDTAVEADETFFLNGSSCMDCTFTDNQGVATIQNDDTSVQFLQPTYTVGEGGGTVTLTVTRVGNPTGAIGVNYVFTGITASGAATCAAGIDFAAVSGTLNWASGDSTPKTFNVAICEDALPEGNESFVSALQSPTGGATIGAQSSTEVTITDNDSDTVAPVISYTPISSNPVSQSLTATVTDAVGVTGVNIFWSINGGGFTSAPCSSAGGTPQNGTWTCIITGEANPAAVAYYVTATDGTNTATNPGGGATAPNLFTVGSATVPGGTYTNLNLGNNVSVGGDVFVNSSLTLNGIVNTGANKLTLACGVPVNGGGEGSYVVGRLERLFCGTETFTFNVGAPFALPPVAPEGETLVPEGIISNYSPLTVNITGGTVGSSLTVSVTDQFLPGSRTDNSASRFWTLTENGNLTANLSFTYRNEDVNGDESIYNVLRRSGGMTMRFDSTNNPATNTATVLEISDFSDWAVGNLIPTAAGADIGGRLLTANGEGIRNATVMITGGNLTAPVYAQTGTFGYYKFSNLPVGQTYVVTVVSKRFTFADPTRVINLLENVTDENFVALEQ
jgi:hypothetical protein